MIVLQSVRQRWLAQTQTWLYDLVRFLPEAVRSHVVCAETANLDQFPFADLHSRQAAPTLWRIGQRVRRELGVESPAAFLDRQSRRLRPDVLHSHFAPQGWVDSRVARRRGIPHVTSFYGYDVNRLPFEQPEWRARYDELFEGVQAVLCEGPHMAECIAELGCPREKLQVHRLGVDLGGIEFRPRAWEGHGPLRVLMAAAFREKKGLPLAIRGLGALAGDLELQITLVGDATDAPGSQREKERILEALATTGLAEHTELCGFLPYAELMRRSYDHHLFLAPSLTAEDGDTEGGAPVSLIQMAATGILVVGSDHCDIPGVVRKDETGFLCREGDLRSLEQELRRALEAAGRWPEMARSARSHIEQTFDARSQGRTLGSIYAAIARGEGARVPQER